MRTADQGQQFSVDSRDQADRDGKVLKPQVQLSVAGRLDNEEMVALRGRSKSNDASVCGFDLRRYSISNPTSREGSAPATNKYARRGDIVFIGGGAVLVIGLCIVGGLAYFDTFHASPPVAEKPTPPSVAEKPADVSRPASPSDAGTAAPAELPAVPQAEPASTPAMADNPPKLPEAQPKPQTPLESEQQVVTTDQTRPEVDDTVDPVARNLIARGWALYNLPYTLVKWQEARRDFEKALELDSRSSEARIGLASILSTKLADQWSPVLQEDPKRAEQLLAAVLGKGDVSKPHKAEAHFTLGVLRQMQNRLSEAQSEFEAAVSLDPNNARTFLHLGQTLLFLGRPEAAIPPLEQAIRLGPDGPKVAITHWALGTCQLLLGRVDQAIDLLQTARAADTRLWVPYFYLAGAYGLQGELDHARSALAESIRLKPAIKSLDRMRVENAWLNNPQYWALQEKTLNLGLRRAGLPDH
jgi:tetratricopeptide (TPR) repeat protein